MAAYRKEIIVGPKIKFFTISCLFLLLSLVILLSTFRLNTLVFVLDNRNIDVLALPHEGPHVKQFPPSPLISFIKKELSGNENIKVGLVNTEKIDDEYWYFLGETVDVGFDRVSNKIQWKDFMREWIDEEHKYRKPKCPEIPMPEFEKYGDDLDVVISRVPCGNETDAARGNGIRDVYRLQVNLVVANLIARSRRNDKPVYVVFIGSCGPMIEIFRCDDLVKHEGDIWIYKPDLRRLQQKVQMPVGSCQLATPFLKQGGSIDYDFTKLGKSIPIDNPREAYVTVLHSSEAYVCGAISLAQSIIQTNSTKDMVILVDESITLKSRQELEFAGWKIKLIDRIHSPHARKNAYNEWNYSKLRIWQLTEYDKLIFIDSDLILLKNIDDFFAYPQLSAVGNDRVRFNSGIMLIEPSKCMFESLMEKRHTVFSYNGGDQGFLNEVFTWWHRWPKRLNHLKLRPKNPSAPEIPESRYAVHFLGFKPWTCYRDYDCNWLRKDHNPFANDMVHQMWWQVYDLMPERLQKVCGLTKVKDQKIQQWRSMAENAKLPDEHWKISITDPRHINLVD
ncbi:hypothetical protein MKX03_018961 [Papaver bracteatum]|nr:hypothetical protein MKX03_018961 [Papaver bracteatum]